MEWRESRAQRRKLIIHSSHNKGFWFHYHGEKLWFNFLCNCQSLLTYKGELVQFVTSFKYLGIYLPTTNKWTDALSLMQPKWYIWMGNEIDVFNVVVAQVLLYGVELWGSNIPLNTWKEIVANISHHCRCFPHSRDLSILDQTTVEIFRRQKA